MTTEPLSSPMELRHLRAFLAVAEHSHFTRAAAALRVSQSSLSRTVATLERCVGQRLIDRNQHVTRLSDAGEHFLPYAHRAVAAADEAFAAVRDKRFPLRIGFTWNALGEDTGPLVNRFEAEHPGATVQLQRCDDDPLAGLADGRSHLAILRTVPNNGLGFLRFLEERRIIALPRSHPLADRDHVTLEETKNDPLVVNIISGSGTPLLWGAVDDSRPLMEVNNIDEWLEAIAAGRGIGASTTSTAKFHPHPRVVYLPLEGAEPVNVIIAWESLDSHPHTAHFIATAKKWRHVRG
ncbi:LysR family transcriptional regulator [Streptomyces hygroscopicus]|uniref:LysR family transcriptional regulator n=1 Tax=Streptomyces hygroscopicus TaxID=1912 RepID=UPI00362963A1